MRLTGSSMALALAFPGIAMADATSTLAQTEAFFAALETRNLEQVENLIDEAVVNTIPFAASGNTTEDAFRIFDGRDQVMAYFAGALERIPKLAFVEPEFTVSADGDTVFVETRGDMVLADGQSYQNLYVWRIDYSGAKITAITEYFNPVTAAIAFNRPIGPQGVE